MSALDKARRDARRPWPAPHDYTGRTLPYRHAELVAAPKDATAYVAGTAAGADALAAGGLVATALQEGWFRHDPAAIGAAFGGRRVVILPANDEAARRRAADVERSLKGGAASVTVLSLPGLAAGADVADWLAAGPAKERLLELVGLAAERLPADPAAWPEPVPLDDAAGDVPAFPLDLLPPAVAEFAAAVAESVHCPPDFPAVACLAAAAAAVGAAAVVEVKEHFRQPAQLFCCLVGDPSVKKSPPIKHVLKPVFTEQAARVERMRGEEWAKDGTALYPHGEGELLASDVTVERLAELLLRQPRGLMLVRQELVGWLASQNQYKAKGQGSDRPFFLEVYDSDPITVHRKNMGQGVLHVPHPSLTLLGGTQPDVVGEFLGRNDGQAERILFCFPANLPARGERWLSIPAGLPEHWLGTLRQLWALPMREIEGHRRPVPHVVRLAAAARPAWQAFTDRLAGEINDPDFPAPLKGTYGKFEGTAARLALVLQLLHQAGGGSDPEVSGAEVAPRWVEAAGRLCFYFGEHAKKVRGHAGRETDLPAARRILAWAAERKRPVTKTEVWGGLRFNQLFRIPHGAAKRAGDREQPRGTELLDAPVRLLARLGHVRWVEGAKPAAFEVNPKSLQSSAPEAADPPEIAGKTP